MKNILLVFGTRPEAIKMAPVYRELCSREQDFKVDLCVTAQHREMLDSVLELFEITPDYDLNLMKPGQNLWDVTSQVLLQMKEVIENAKPDVVLVHGDTTTAFATAISAFYSGVKIGHVEAGLRSYNLQSPFPEEMNRIAIDQIASFCFAPTTLAVRNLEKSGVPKEKIFLTTNTVIDALKSLTGKEVFKKHRLTKDEDEVHILVTMHRRENFGRPMERVISVIQDICMKYSNVRFTIPVHPNPNVKSLIENQLRLVQKVKLVEPFGYLDFVAHMEAADIIMTDSGGVQEEAPTFGKPILVLRDTTERQEVVEAGIAKLVASDVDLITSELTKLIENRACRTAAKEIPNPYGEGEASQKIVDVLAASE